MRNPQQQRTLITVADGGMSGAPSLIVIDRGNAQVATGGSSVSTSLANCSIMPAAGPAE
jgi:hypothetical protein